MARCLDKHTDFTFIYRTDVSSRCVRCSMTFERMVRPI
jgi:hypothetical protein